MRRILLVAALAVFLSSCTPDTPPDVQEKVVYLVRHAEKCTEPADNPALTPFGQERARSLARVLHDVPLDVIYSTPLNRTRDTVEPLASALGIPIVETPIKEGFMEALADSIRAAAASRILVSGHSNTTARMVNLLAGTDLPDLEESQYDRLFVVHLGAAPAVDVLRYGSPSGSAESCL
jgi:phosphohistidine phosphatase SixA